MSIFEYSERTRKLTSTVARLPGGPEILKSIVDRHVTDYRVTREYGLENSELGFRTFLSDARDAGVEIPDANEVFHISSSSENDDVNGPADWGAPRSERKYAESFC